MTPCPNCGHVPTMKTTFCPQCGSPIAAEAVAAPVAAPAAAPPAARPTPTPAAAAVAAPIAATGPLDSRGHHPVEDIDNGKMFAILGYLISFIWLVPLFQRDNAYSLYHAKQALTYNLIVIIAMIPISIIGIFTFGCGYVLFLPLMYPWIMGLVNAAQGKYEPMPWIGKMGEDWFKGIVADKRPGGWPPQ